MKQSKNQRSLSLVSALLVLAVFSVCVLGVLLGGAQAYQRLTSRDEQTYDRRTCVQYIASKVRQVPGEIGISAFGDGDALLIYESHNGKDYLTRVYCYDGWLMELFTAEGGIFAPEDGEKILPLQALALDYRDNLLTADILSLDGQTQRMKLYVREVQP